MLYLISAHGDREKSFGKRLLVCDGILVIQASWGVVPRTTDRAAKKLAID